MAARPQIPCLGGKNVLEPIFAGSNILPSYFANDRHFGKPWRHRPALGIAKIRAERSGLGIVELGLDEEPDYCGDRRNHRDLDTLRGDSQKPATLVALVLDCFTASHRAGSFYTTAGDRSAVPQVRAARGKGSGADGFTRADDAARRRKHSAAADVLDGRFGEIDGAECLRDRNRLLQADRCVGYNDCEDEHATDRICGRA